MGGTGRGGLVCPWFTNIQKPAASPAAGFILASNKNSRIAVVTNLISSPQISDRSRRDKIYLNLSRLSFLDHRQLSFRFIKIVPHDHDLR